MKTRFKIADKWIGEGEKPFIIAEMSGNHNQSIDRAKAIIDSAAECGADAIKLQTYTADTITMEGVHYISDENSLWKGQELYNLYKQAYTPWEWHKELFEHARSRGIIMFSSPFDETAVDFLESLNTPAYKIASFENTHISLLKKVAATKKPVILSTGVSTIGDIMNSVKVLIENGSSELVLLKCTSTYPASPSDTNIMTIPHMRALYKCAVGLSDHTMGVGVAVASVALGATVIEKHFTLSRADGGVDSAFSLEPAELRSLVVESERAWLSLGEVNYELSEKEKQSLKYKRSIYVSADLKQGTRITAEMIKVIRPAYGLEPKYLEQVLGMRVRKDVKRGTPLSWDLLESDGK